MNGTIGDEWCRRKSRMLRRMNGATNTPFIEYNMDAVVMWVKNEMDHINFGLGTILMYTFQHVLYHPLSPHHHSLRNILNFLPRCHDLYIDPHWFCVNNFETSHIILCGT
jgi:hypothetical protein